jgi:hypothetical protein
LRKKNFLIFLPANTTKTTKKMKPMKALFAMAAVCLVVLSSCKKSSSDTQPATTFAFKVDGTAKSTSNVVGIYDKATQTVMITGSLGLTEGVTIGIPNVKVGTFDVFNDGITATYSNGVDITNTYVAVSGTVTVTSFTSNTVSGTFSFVGTNQSNATKNITEGKFTTKYVSQ